MNIITRKYIMFVGNVNKAQREEKILLLLKVSFNYRGL